MLAAAAIATLLAHAPSAQPARALRLGAGAARAPRTRPARAALAMATPPEREREREFDAQPRLQPRGARAGAEIEPVGDGPSEAELLSDIARFKERDVANALAGGAAGPSPALAVINGLGLVLTCNFVVIVGLFGWFLVGAVAQLGFKSMAPITAFRDAWDPFILPLLTTHMALTFLSKALEKLTGNEPDGSIGGGWDIKL